jgi:hypothetical protein
LYVLQITLPLAIEAVSYSRDKSTLRKNVFYLLVAVCVAFCIFIALDLIPLLRGYYDWQWAYRVPNWLRILPLASGTIIYIIGLTRIKENKRYQLWCFVAAIALPVAALFVIDNPYNLLAKRVFAGEPTGQHMAGAQITDLLETARTWPQIMPSYSARFGRPGEVQRPLISIHIGSNPPGLPMMFYVLNQALEKMPALADFAGMPLRYPTCQMDVVATYDNAHVASAWFNILMPLWSALTVFPLYRLGGKLVAGWWPLIPSIAFFTPMWNVIYPLMVTVAFLLFKKGIADIQSKQYRGLLQVIFAGLIVSLTTFGSFTCLPLIGFFGLYLGFSFIKWWKLQKISLNAFMYQVLLAGLIFTISALSVWIVYYLISSVRLYDVIQAGLVEHFGMGRNYFVYLFYNPYELALFTGIPLILVAISSLKWPRSWEDIDPLAVALLLTLLITNNIARGETGRYWSFFIPFILILAARGIARFSPRQASIITATQALTFCVILSFLYYFGTDMETAPPPTFPQVTTNPLPYETKFGNYLTLLGMKSDPKDDGIELTLLWQVDKQMSVPYVFSAQVVDSNGQYITDSHVFQPYGYNPKTYYPLTCWRPGQTYLHTEKIPLKSKLSPAIYWISFAVMDSRNLGRLPISEYNNPSNNQIGLGPVEVH